MYALTRRYFLPRRLPKNTRANFRNGALSLSDGVNNEYRRDRGTARVVIASPYTAGFIGVRLQGTRYEETNPIVDACERAVKMRLALE